MKSESAALEGLGYSLLALVLRRVLGCMVAGRTFLTELSMVKHRRGEARKGGVGGRTRIEHVRGFVLDL